MKWMSAAVYGCRALSARALATACWSPELADAGAGAPGAGGTPVVRQPEVTATASRIAATAGKCLCDMVRGSAKGCWERRRSASTIAWGRASRMVLYHAFTSAAGRRRSLDELDGQTVGIFDHCRPCVTEDVRLLQYLHPCATQSLKRRVQRLDRERDVIQRLAARWNERPVLPASRVHALPRIPRHRAVSKSHAARRLTDGARGLERWPSRLAVLHLAGVPARARRF